ncbi:hypothetical protein CVT25_003654, partial [Psilocybe cyanescens]
PSAAIQLSALERHLPALYLYPLNDTWALKHIALANLHTKIGRQTSLKKAPGKRNGFFDSKVLSRQHAEVWEEGGKDVKSSNGSFIYGERLSSEGHESDRFELKSDDIIEFGIDIAGKDNKVITHHKFATRVPAGLPSFPAYVPAYTHAASGYSATAAACFSACYYCCCTCRFRMLGSRIAHSVFAVPASISTEAGKEQGMTEGAGTSTSTSPQSAATTSERKKSTSTAPATASSSTSPQPTATTTSDNAHVPALSASIIQDFSRMRNLRATRSGSISTVVPRELESVEDEEALARAEHGEDGHGHEHGQVERVEPAEEEVQREEEEEGGHEKTEVKSETADRETVKEEEADEDRDAEEAEERRWEDLGVGRPRTPEPSMLSMGDRARRSSVSSPLAMRRVESHEGEDGESESESDVEADTTSSATKTQIAKEQYTNAATTATCSSRR